MFHTRHREHIQATCAKHTLNTGNTYSNIMYTTEIVCTEKRRLFKYITEILHKWIGLVKQDLQINEVHDKQQNPTCDITYKVKEGR
jgi:hypothetical protein